jgi:hypothetical protein
MQTLKQALMSLGVAEPQVPDMVRQLRMNPRPMLPTRSCANPGKTTTAEMTLGMWLVFGRHQYLRGRYVHSRKGKRLRRHATPNVWA